MRFVERRQSYVVAVELATVRALELRRRRHRARRHPDLVEVRQVLAAGQGEVRRAVGLVVAVLAVVVVDGQLAPLGERAPLPELVGSDLTALIGDDFLEPRIERVLTGRGVE